MEDIMDKKFRAKELDSSTIAFHLYRDSQNGLMIDLHSIRYIHIPMFDHQVKVKCDRIYFETFVGNFKLVDNRLYFKDDGDYKLIYHLYETDV